MPLSRYYACHKNDLETPFKTIQIGRVYRAERPQKGRLREFVQCDIDILGSDSMDCEVELISVTAEALLAVGIDEFKVRINHRNLLRNLIIWCGFPAEASDTVCVTVDKADKIGFDGVKAELCEKGFGEEAADKLISILTGDLRLEALASYGCEAEAEVLLRNHLAKIEQDIQIRIVERYGLTLTPNQFDALVLFSYNCGTSWAYETNGTFHQAIVKRFDPCVRPVVQRRRSDSEFPAPSPSERGEYVLKRCI